jgi:hypothetical protein
LFQAWLFPTSQAFRASKQTRRRRPITRRDRILAIASPQSLAPRCRRWSNESDTTSASATTSAPCPGDPATRSISSTTTRPTSPYPPRPPRADSNPPRLRALASRLANRTTTQGGHALPPNTAEMDAEDQYFSLENRLASFRGPQPVSKGRPSAAASRAPKALAWPHKTLSPSAVRV